MTLNTVTLDDKYSLDQGRIFLTGSQALVRLLLVQRRRDLSCGLNTAGFISGYRGSPMTAIDQELWRAESHLEVHHIKFWPGVNEHLAATAVWGTQGVHYFGDQKYDGVFGLWYGKGPGLDQSLDAIRQGNYYGSAPNGGVMILAGDDPAMRSTIDAYHSELLFEDLLMPVLYPADIQEVFLMGLHGIALSRFSGAWVGYKLLPETIETAASIQADHEQLKIVIPEFEMPPGGLNSRHPDSVYLQEERLRQYKLPAAVAYARANKLNAITHDCPNARIGIAAMGKTWRDTLQALRDLGLEESDLQDLGVRILKVAMPFPVDEEIYREFANGLEEILVIEDKREQIENALRKVCYSLPEDRKPKLTGRHNENGLLQIANFGDLTPDAISSVLAKRLGSDRLPESVGQRIAYLEDQASRKQERKPLSLNRLPYFCSGCPHNTSTQIPEGSRGNSGVGCHYMVTWMDRNVDTYTQMGGEGIPWIGQAPFVESNHVFQQLGDGTYYHSGSVAIRASIAAGTNITYKILYNDAVAMTGGQPVDGELTVPAITQQVRNEGVQRIAVVTDEPEKYRGVSGLAGGTTIHHRRELNEVQQEMREIEGVTVLVYDQTCAAEKRRRRKRGNFPDPAKRVFINDRVCEGCGDCGVKSNCVSVLPFKTFYGTKRQIDQSSCNKDYSCNEGFCPSFVTVLGGQPRQGEGVGGFPEELAKIPSPDSSARSIEQPYGILLCGVGGTGVVTLGAIIGMAAHLDGKGVSIVDQLGFAQKGGPVQTHIRIARSTKDIHSARLNTGNTDLVVGCDSLVAAGDAALETTRRGRTHAVINTHKTITGDFTRNPDLEFPASSIKYRLRQAFDDDHLDMLEATNMAISLLGSSIASNIFLLGYAWQKGLVPLDSEAILGAIELNGVSVEWNKKAFGWGRRVAHNMAAVQALIERQIVKPVAPDPETPEETLAYFANELESYQDSAYADRYRQLVTLAKDAELSKAPGKNGFADAVVRYAYKLMAYKDEYEIGRLHSDAAFHQKLEAAFEGKYKLEFNLAPPLLARKDKVTGRPRKMQFGQWMLPVFGLLARLKFLRKTPFDPFGWTAERRMERNLVRSYFRAVEELSGKLNPENHALAVEIASLPEKIRGYGYIKEENLDEVLKQEERLMETWRTPQDQSEAA